MNTRLVLVLTIMAAVSVAARGQAPVSTAFTYQGQLKESGVPVTGQADMIFHLWDAETGGSLYDSYGISFIPVDDGLFTVELDFGSAPFEGEARWLEIEVEFPSGAGNWTTLSPRQPMTPTPYAVTAMQTIGVDGHSLDAADGSPTNRVYVDNDGRIRLGYPGGSLSRMVNIRGGMDVFDDDGVGTSEGISFTSSSFEFRELVGETPIWDYFQSTDMHRFYTGDATLRLTIASDGNIGIGTPSPSYPLHVEGSGARTVYAENDSASGAALEARATSGGTAVRAYSTSTVSGGYGLNAYAAAPSARAVYAFNEAESGDAYAVYGENISPDGIAIYGLADSGDEYSTGIGVYGRSDSDHPGIGVYGETTNTGTTYGVRGVSAHGTGVRGENTETANYGALGRHFEGVYGQSDYGVSGIGVHGKWTGAYPGYGYGGAFTTTSHLAAGVLGQNEATEPGGIGVIGVHEHTTGAGYGVRGETASSEGHGVHGYASATSGANRGVCGETDSSTGYAGYFVGGRNYFEGRVGIGTTDPLAKLHVEESQADDLLRVRQGGSTKFIVKNDGRVGIGTSAPDVELEVVGDVQVSGDYTYLSSQTHYLNMPACKFHESNAYDPDADDRYKLYESGYGHVWGTTIELLSPVHLPDGATVTEFRVYYYDNRTTSDMTINASLYARTLYQITEPTTMASISVTTSGAVDAVESSYDDTIDLPLINNTLYQYYVWLTLDQDAYGLPPGKRFYGSKIEYTIDTLNP